jgi:chromosome segregation ATPase
MSTDNFWERYPIPFQDEFGGEYEFANPVVVQQHLIRDIAMTAELTQMAEALIKQIANEEVQMSQAERELGRLRTQILAKYYSEVTKSSSGEIKDAFVLMKAKEDGKDQQIVTLEDTIERHRRALEILNPRLQLITSRLKAIDKKSERATSYLNQERLLMKLEHNNNRMV